MPSPVTDETATTGAPASTVPSRCSHDLLFGDRERLLVDEVALRERDHAAGHAEHVEDLEVLLGLRLPALVGGHDEQRRAAPGPRPASMLRMNRSWPGHVDEPDLASARQLAPRVAEVDREAAALLLGPPVGVDAGEPHDQRRLAVVDVPGRATTPRALPRRRSATSVLVVEVVALEGVPGRAREVGHLFVGHRAQVEQHVVALDAAEHATGCRRAGGPRTPTGRARVTRTPHDGSAVPGIEPPPTMDSHRCTCACSRSPPIVSLSSRARRCTAATGSRNMRRDGHLALRAGRRHRRAPARARPPASCRPAPLARPGARAAERRGRPCPPRCPPAVPPSSLSAEHSHEVGAVGERVGHRWLVGGHARFVPQQAGAHVVEEGHAVLDARARRGRRAVAAAVNPTTR